MESKMEGRETCRRERKENERFHSLHDVPRCGSTYPVDELNMGRIVITPVGCY
jgi:hypothetical protein